MATYDDELTLIEQVYGSDNIGNQIPSEKKTTILCDSKSVSRAEFYNAANNGMKPTRIFLIHKFEYDEQQKVEFEGKRYDVIKTYKVNSEEIELTCQRMIGNG
ncbi:SPP1 family predicted phage head-tail adaptor [Cytobacillus firmus]|uniref:SPP1 family predicted phage head-tail adaptor n=2 Tax=Cytobacillus TaxID=2675230 RepID=A0A366JNI6_CYTFI|nr:MULTISPECIES: phage head closure protein [Cytobacillus]RBP89395.1 SPP1 family predicted phage head-tail adaptor [Cytobacillus firmus]TDX47378.1 SPP1 family predicted phage head-tail adaptor [Cytobacillus oceanisediminis]